MIDHRYKKNWITDILEREGYLVKHTAVGKIVVRSKDDKKRICSINYESMRVEFENTLSDDIELAVTTILEVCEKKMRKDGVITEDEEYFTVV